ncbi:MAG: hypothetical protein ACON4T_10250 [Synechococcus sp.]
MLDQSLIVIGAGPLPELSMRRGAESLADGVGLPLITLPVGARPDASLQSLATGSPSLLRLTGDPGRLGVDGQSWLDALGAWRLPTLLLGAPLADGSIPGVVPSFCALCEHRRVPLLALVQLGGVWNPQQRRQDGLPWCGWLGDPQDPASGVALDALITLLRQRRNRFSSAVATTALPSQS